MNTLTPFLSELKLGEPQKFKNLAVVPLFARENGGPAYITLEEGLDLGTLKVTEVDQSGSVPTLRVHNDADLPVLLLDGEELAGAKQNRVLNTSILVPERTKLDIPVSCTEQGRWSYTSPEFLSSKTPLSPQLRSEKLKSVTDSLKARKRYDGNQGEVWDGVTHFACRLGVNSPTGALKDVHDEHSLDLDEFEKAFVLKDRQRGLLVFKRDRVVGFDIVSRSEAYARLHLKLVRSYAMDALVERKKDGAKPDLDVARQFLGQASEAVEQKYESVGHGWDHRFTGPRVVGSALLHEDTVIHAGFFRSRDRDRPEDAMRSSALRRGFRNPG